MQILQHEDNINVGRTIPVAPKFSIPSPSFNNPQNIGDYHGVTLTEINVELPSEVDLKAFNYSSDDYKALKNAFQTNLKVTSIKKVGIHPVCPTYINYKFNVEAVWGDKGIDSKAFELSLTFSKHLNRNSNWVETKSFSDVFLTASGVDMLNHLLSNINFSKYEVVDQEHHLIKTLGNYQFDYPMSIPPIPHIPPIVTRIVPINQEFLDLIAFQ